MTKMAKFELLKKVEVKSLGDIKKGDLFYSSNNEGQLNEAMCDGVDTPDLPELGKITTKPMDIVSTLEYHALKEKNDTFVTNIGIAEQNLKNVAGQLTKAMNILFNVPEELFDDEAREFVTKYKTAHAQLKEMELPKDEETVNISDLDLTKQTITLGEEDNPSVSLMRGHVNELTFVKGFYNEGWGNHDPKPTEEDFKKEAENEKGELVHTYGKEEQKNGKSYWTWNMEKDDMGVEPITLRHW